MPWSTSSPVDYAMPGTPDVLDLYATNFDPVFTMADVATWQHPDMPADILERWNPRQAVLDNARGPIQHSLAARCPRVDRRRTSR